MGSFKNIVVVIVGFWAVGSLGDVCGYLPARTGVGRSSSTAYDAKADWCPGQIKACDLICGGKTTSNTCTLSSPSYACYSCECSSSTTPALDIYYGTIPQRICEQKISNCAASPSGSFTGECDRMPKCGSINPDPTPPAPVKIWPTVEAPAPSVVPEPVVIPEPVLEVETSSPAAVVSTTSVVISTSSTLTTTSSVVSTSSIIPSSTLITSSTAFGLNTTSSAISSSTTVSLSTESSTSRSSTRTTSRSSTAVATSVAQGVAAAMMTSAPWVQAAIGVAGFVLAGL